MERLFFFLVFAALVITVYFGGQRQTITVPELGDGHKRLADEALAAWAAWKQDPTDMESKRRAIDMMSYVMRMGTIMAARNYAATKDGIDLCDHIEDLND